MEIFLRSKEYWLVISEGTMELAAHDNDRYIENGNKKSTEERSQSKELSFPNN